MKQSRPLILSLVVFLILTPTILLNNKPVHAIPGVSPPDPTNQWAPYGPFVKNLRFQYYADPNAEYTDFEAGHLDVVDWSVPTGKFTSYDINPDFLESPVQGEFGLFGIYFNGASSTWKAWGCDWSNSTGTEYTSQCGIEMRQGFAHLINRGDFANNNIARPAVGLADPSPSSKDPAGTPFATQCAWDQSVMVEFNTACYNHWGGIQPGAYTITGSGNPCTPLTPTGTGPVQLYQSCPHGLGRPAVGSPDFCAAALHMINSGVAIGMTSTCVLTGVNPGVLSHHLRFFPRITNPRRALGMIFFDELNALFGTLVVDIRIGTINELGPIVFNNEPGRTDDWDAYTYGYSEAGPFGGDALFQLYHGQFASPNGGVCGASNPVGVDITTPNPTYMCNPKLNALLVTQSQAQNLDLNSYNANTLAVLNYFGAIAGDLVAYSPGLRTVALRSTAGLVNAKALGYNNPWTILNAHKGSYVPINPAYPFGGADPTTLRYGQASGTTHLNPFTVATIWEFNVLGEIYDTLLTANPLQPSQIFCWLCNTYSTSVDLNGNEHFLVEMRQDLRWHDGVPLDAKDVAFSLLGYGDLPRTDTHSLGGLLLKITVLSSTTLDIAFIGESVFYPVALETLIIPRHLFQCDLVPEHDCAAGAAAVIAAGGYPSDYTNAGVNVPSAYRTSPAFDIVAGGALVGSGPFMCRSLFPEDHGRVGAGCILNPDGTRGAEAIPIGGSVQLEAFDRTSEPDNSDPFLQYMRSYNPSWGTGTGTAAESGQFQEFSWADHNHDLTVDVSDLGNVAGCFDASGPRLTCTIADYNYWLRPAFHPNNPNTISTEVAIVASHLDDTWIAPLTCNSGVCPQGILLGPPP